MNHCYDNRQFPASLPQLGWARRQWAALLAMAILLVGAAPTAALTINRQFVASGDMFPLTSIMAGDAPANTAGGGTIQDIFDTAADWWEQEILDPHVTTIRFGWASLDTTAQAQMEAPLPFTQGDILFDNDGSTKWFMDQTPHINEEYNTFGEYEGYLGGDMLINLGRVYFNAMGDAVDRHDLLTVAKHQLGHALGVAHGFPPDLMPVPTLTITAPRPHAGISVPTLLSGHIDIPPGLMFPIIDLGERKMPSDVDILVAAERSGFSNLNSAPVVAAPSPTAFWMGVALLTAVCAGVVYRPTAR